MLQKLLNTDQRNSLLALFTLSGTIIGVGIFALPFVAFHVGMGSLFLYFIILAVLVAVVHLLFAQVVLWTKGEHRLPGYAHIYLGTTGGWIASIENTLSLAGSLLAYLIVGGGFLHLILQPLWGAQPLYGVLLFFIPGALLVFSGIRQIARVEVIGFLLFIATIAVFMQQGGHFWQFRNIVGSGELSAFFPFGIVLFALWGVSVVPEVVALLKKKRQAVRGVIVKGIGLAAITYIIFAAIVAGIAGELVSEDALSALSFFFADWVIALALFFGFLTCFTSFITLGLTLKKVLWFDFKLDSTAAWALAMFVPFLLYFFGFQSFITVIGIIGGVLLAFEGMLVVLIYLKARKAASKTQLKSQVVTLPQALAVLLLLVFAMGILQEMYKLIV